MLNEAEALLSLPSLRAVDLMVFFINFSFVLWSMHTMTGTIFQLMHSTEGAQYAICAVLDSFEKEKRACTKWNARTLPLLLLSLMLLLLQQLLLHLVQSIHTKAFIVPTDVYGRVRCLL
mmetsp:Transcript_5382/g.14449  ORF Transcript_5382/g.14449 Transcript_5382/m.14449 type:complete len:119 (-) Transcript_5382:2049-2405(-)